jgi:hypothetical protein
VATTRLNVPSRGEERTKDSRSSARDGTPPRRKRRTQQPSQKTIAAPEPEAWCPADFGDQRRTRIGASIVEEFVAGHDASDVLRELCRTSLTGAATG